MRALVALHAMLVVYSFSGVFSKLASRHEFLSVPFVLYYGAMLLCLAAYAVGWQQVIKRMPLITAYANRAVTVIWGIVWGTLFFREDINAPKLIGAALVLAGVILFAWSDHASEGDGGERQQ